MKNVLNKILGIIVKAIRYAVDAVIYSVFTILALVACACIVVAGFGASFIYRQKPSEMIYTLFDEFAETFTSDI